jgi:hypothetical protein
MSLPVPKQLPDGRWTARYTAPPGPDGKRRQPRVYGRIKKECSDALVAALGRVSVGSPVDDRRAKYGEHLDRRLRWWESEHEIKPSTLASYREAADLYLRPRSGTCAWLTCATIISGTWLRRCARSTVPRLTRTAPT